jgi:hypothetical protein
LGLSIWWRDGITPRLVGWFISQLGTRNCLGVRGSCLGVSSNVVPGFSGNVVSAAWQGSAESLSECQRGSRLSHKSANTRITAAAANLLPGGLLHKQGREPAATAPHIAGRWKHQQPARRPGRQAREGRPPMTRDIRAGVKPAAAAGSSSRQQAQQGGEARAGWRQRATMRPIDSSTQGGEVPFISKNRPLGPMQWG